MPRAANDNFKPRKTLSWGTEFLMLSVAIVFDVLGVLLGMLDFIPFVGIPLSMILNAMLVGMATAVFWLWFKLAVGHRAKGKALAKQPLYKTITAAVELVLGFLPGQTLYILLSIRDVKKEDAMYNKKMSQEQQTQYYRTHRAANDNQPRYRRSYKAAA